MPKNKRRSFHMDMSRMHLFFWHGVVRRPRVLSRASGGASKKSIGTLTRHVWIPAELHGGALSMQRR